jgi:hypothetical protein
MNQFAKIATLIFRLFALYMLGVCIHGVLAITGWALGEWLFVAEAILLLVFSRPLGQLVGRGLG